MIVIEELRMASIVLGIGTSHTPLLILPPQLWKDYADRDRGNRDLVFPPAGLSMSYGEAVGGYVGDGVRERVGDIPTFKRQHEVVQSALDGLARSLWAASPDAVVIISDDQDEWFYDDNMPALSIYWGDSAPVIPRPVPTAGTETDKNVTALINQGYAAGTYQVEVASALGRHLIEFLMQRDFDVSRMSSVRDSYSGSVHRWYPRPDGSDSDYTRHMPARPVGLPHGFSFVVERLLKQVAAPIIPIIQNTCYPPNNVRPRRCFAIGEAIADGLAAWPGEARIAVIASGGLSHFVVDEEVDRALLAGLAARDKTALTGLPQERLRSATSECLNWVTLGGVMSRTDLDMELLAYEPVYRTEAGTGAGLGFARWPAGEVR
jgi:hypothetical protein